MTSLRRLTLPVVEVTKDGEVIVGIVVNGEPFACRCRGDKFKMGHRWFKCLRCGTRYKEEEGKVVRQFPLPLQNRKD